jgi:hypothetical protein
MPENIVFNTESNLTGEKISIEWRDLVGKRIPGIAWKQVHIVSNFNGKVVLVYLEKLGLYHLPGGHVEPGEDVEMTLRRELAEETSGIVIEWEPIGYQIRTDSRGNVDNQLRVYAKVSNIQPQTIDIDGSLVPTKLVDIDDMNKELGWENPIGQRIHLLVKNKYIISETSTADLKNEVSNLLSKVKPLLDKHGDVNFIGSYEWGTMYDRDVDIELWLNPDEIKLAQRNIVNDLINLDNVYEIKTRDLISFNTDSKNGRNLKCILIMLKMFNEDGHLWNFDICLFDKTDENNNALPFGQEVLKKIQGMSDQQKRAVIDIKKATTTAGLYLKGRSSVDIYLRVVEDGVLTPDEYMSYARRLADESAPVPPKKRKKV